jgi:hypothetical protein
VAERTEAVVDVLESVLATIRNSRAGAPATERTLGEACQTLASWKELGLAGHEPLAPVDRARELVAQAARDLPDWVEEARPTLDDVLGELLTLRTAALNSLGAPELELPRAARAATQFVASSGSPALRFDVEVPPLELIREERDVALEIAAALASPLTDLEDDDEAPRRDSHVAPIPERRRLSSELLQAVGRDVLEDVGMLGALRRPLDTEAWTSPIRFEKRLFAQLDALFSLGLSAHPDEPTFEIVREAYAFATEWSVPDLGRAYALALPLASMSGHAAARWLLAAMRHAHPRTIPAFVDALALGVNPELSAAVADRLTAVEAPHVLVGLLDVARRRRDVPVSAITFTMSFGDEAVVEAALRALASVELAQSGPLLRDFVDANDRLATAAVASLAALGDPLGLVASRAALTAELRNVGDPYEHTLSRRGISALATLACAGQLEDEALVLRAAHCDGPELLRWLGHFGHPPFAEALFRFIDDPARRTAARRGLAVLLGGDVEWELPIDGLDGPPQEDLAERREERRAVARSAGARLRRGRPHAGARTVLEDLRAPTTIAGDREALRHELSMIVGAVLPLDVEDWISRQVGALELLRFDGANAP